MTTLTPPSFATLTGKVDSEMIAIAAGQNVESVMAAEMKEFKAFSGFAREGNWKLDRSVTIVDRTDADNTQYSRLSVVLPQTCNPAQFLVSYNSQRLDEEADPIRDPGMRYTTYREKAFAQIFPSFFPTLQPHLGEITVRDLRVIATLVQRMGSSNGFSHIKECLKPTSPSLRDTCALIEVPSKPMPANLNRMIEGGVAIDHSGRKLFNLNRWSFEKAGFEQVDPCPSAIAYRKGSLSANFAAGCIHDFGYTNCSTPLCGTGVMTTRDQILAGTLSVWLGSNDGKEFLTQSLARITTEETEPLNRVVIAKMLLSLAETSCEEEAIERFPTVAGR